MTRIIIKIFLLLSILLLFSCERRRNCKGVDGIEFNENIIELVDDLFCLKGQKQNSAFVIIDSLSFATTYQHDSTICKSYNVFNFSEYSLLTYLTKGGGCSYESYRFEFKSDGDFNTLDVYPCKRNCFIGAKYLLPLQFIFKIKKVANTDIKLTFHE